MAQPLPDASRAAELRAQVYQTRTRIAKMPQRIITLSLFLAWAYLP